MMKALSHARSPVETGSLEPQRTQRKANEIMTRIPRLPNSGHTPCIFDAGEIFSFRHHWCLECWPDTSLSASGQQLISPLRSLRLERTKRVGER